MGDRRQIFYLIFKIIPMWLSGNKYYTKNTSQNDDIWQNKLQIMQTQDKHAIYIYKAYVRILLFILKQWVDYGTIWSTNINDVIGW